jgi:hypothetical protein
MQMTLKKKAKKRRRQQEFEAFGSIIDDKMDKLHDVITHYEAEKLNLLNIEDLDIVKLLDKKISKVKKQKFVPKKQADDIIRELKKIFKK